MNILDAINWKGVIIIWSCILSVTYLEATSYRIKRERGENIYSKILHIIALTIGAGAGLYGIIAFILCLFGNPILIELLHQGKTSKNDVTIKKGLIMAIFNIISSKVVISFVIAACSGVSLFDLGRFVWNKKSKQCRRK